MNLGVQYYRAPFPNAKYWADDFAKIREAGLNTVQLWVLWGWVEAKPGEFRFDDYDRLVDLAAKNGIGVILSTIAEIQPYWILREVPGCELVNREGHPVKSVNRSEAHFGITPGGCTDHPGIWDRMKQFLATTVSRYRGAKAVRGWDAWNELRWNVHAESPVCYCEHTLGAFRAWLQERFGGLDGLNEVWQRRYGSWDEVDPGRLRGCPYTEMMAFQHFLTARADRHARARYEVMKPLAAPKPVTAHGPAPCVLMPGGGFDQALNRGNDWFIADGLDGVGCSSFPKWFPLDDADFGLRVEAVKSAARDKLVWLSEVQGGRAATGFKMYDSVDARSQQRWIWNGLGCGADTIIFWCWRDEVFGYESAGFGLVGDDGLADERLAAMRVTAQTLEKHRKLFDAYRPDKAQVGLLFSPQAYYLTWAEEENARRAQNALVGYARALTRRSIPYMFVEEAHLDALDGLKILFMPRAIVTDEATEKAFEAFVRAGGTLVCESEAGAFNSQGLYRYPADRFTARLAGIREVGRRKVPAGEVLRATVGGKLLTLGVTQWVTPWQTGKGTVLSEVADGAAIVEVPIGKGRLVLAASYFGDAYLAKWSADFEEFLALEVAAAGVKPDVEVLSPLPKKDFFVYTKLGRAGGKRVLFVFFPEGGDEVVLRLPKGAFAKAKELTGGGSATLTDSHEGRLCVMKPTPHGYAVLVEA